MNDFPLPSCFNRLLSSSPPFSKVPPVSLGPNKPQTHRGRNSVQQLYVKSCVLSGNINQEVVQLCLHVLYRVSTPECPRQYPFHYLLGQRCHKGCGIVYNSPVVVLWCTRCVLRNSHTRAAYNYLTVSVVNYFPCFVHSFQRVVALPRIRCVQSSIVASVRYISFRCFSLLPLSWSMMGFGSSMENLHLHR